MSSPLFTNPPCLLSHDVNPISHPIQLVFFDIDGTLLGKDGQYSLSLKQQIQRIHKLGVKTAIASGRPSYAAQFLVDELDIVDMGVFCTGAEIYHPRQQQHIAVHSIALQSVREIVQRAQAEGIYCELYTPTHHTVEKASDISQIHGEHLRVKPIIMPPDTLLFESPPIIKLLLGRDTHNTGQCLETFAREFPLVDFAFAHFLARPDWEFASVISTQASKITAFDQVTNYYGIAAENVMSIGDSQSDMVFIERAGVGVAMGNASAKVKSVANYITLSADDDGVAFALERLVK
jgi:5-amino-6-(5-phospho-D-ribitylamino)uracil phosphatase